MTLIEDPNSGGKIKSENCYSLGFIIFRPPHGSFSGSQEQTAEFNQVGDFFKNQEIKLNSI